MHTNALLTCLIIAALGPIEIKAAEEQLYSNPKPIILLVKLNWLSRYFDKPLQELVGNSAHVKLTPEPNTTSNDIASASCLLFDIVPEDYFTKKKLFSIKINSLNYSALLDSII